MEIQLPPYSTVKEAARRIGVIYVDGETIAIEAELSTKKPFELAENLLELLRGEEYLSSKMDLGGPLDALGRESDKRCFSGKNFLPDRK